MNFRKTAVLTAALLLTGLTGCATTPAQDADTNAQAESLNASETWAKAADQGMTAAFGVLHNDSDSEIALRGATDAQGDVIELHEVRDGNMAQLEGDLVIAPGEDSVLAPGGNHLMFIDLKQPLVAAQTITLNLEFADGSKTEVDFPIRNFDGAKENYGEHDSEHGEHDN